ncbi:MAG: PAS domain-containing protein [Rhizobium sp.]|nr:PAS domain-containing protein [Rhizobium sp.]
MMLEDLYRLLRSGHIQAQGVVDTMTQPIVVLDQNLCVSTANNAFLRTFQVERDDVSGRSFFDLGNGQWDIPDLHELMACVVPKAHAVVGYEVKHEFANIGERTFLVDARRLVHPDDNSTSMLVLFDDVTERQRRDLEKDMILSETRHRMRNLFAVVRSLAMRIKVDDLTAAEYRNRFLSRLHGTLRAQEVAASADAMDLETLALQSVGETAVPQLTCVGPTVVVAGHRIVSLSMIFHELATNSMKYGALSVPAGKVHARWSIEPAPDGGSQIRFEWREEGGPMVSPPQHMGFGSELIVRMATHLGGSAELSYHSHGLAVALVFPSESA